MFVLWAAAGLANNLTPNNLAALQQLIAMASQQQQQSCPQSMSAMQNHGTSVVGVLMNGVMHLRVCQPP